MLHLKDSHSFTVLTPAVHKVYPYNCTTHTGGGSKPQHQEAAGRHELLLPGGAQGEGRVVAGKPGDRRQVRRAHLLPLNGRGARALPRRPHRLPARRQPLRRE